MPEVVTAKESKKTDSGDKYRINCKYCTGCIVLK